MSDQLEKDLFSVDFRINNRLLLKPQFCTYVTIINRRIVYFGFLWFRLWLYGRVK